jgi:Ca-activated chloride channel family protein
MRLQPRILMSVCVALLLAVSTASAQGWIEPHADGDPFGVVKLRTVVSVTVDGRAARVQVEEWFENRGGGLGEGDYLYPLPGEAVFSGFSLFQGDLELTGETMDAQEARAIYEEIVRRKKDPALIELVGHGLIRSRVFPIEPGQTRKITLRYTVLLERAGDAHTFRYAAGRHMQASGMPFRPILEGRVGPPTHGVLREWSAPGSPSTAPLTFSVVVEDGDRYRDAFSPTHDVENERRNGRLTVRPAGDLEGDFTLFLPLSEPEIGMTLATHRPSGSEDGYFMLTLSPGEARGGTMPRDITLVVDVSGSMSGSKLNQAKDAMRRFLSSLNPDDRFRLIAFSNSIRSYEMGWSPVARDEIEAAEVWIDRLQADGGTNIDGALAEALSIDAGSPERMSMVLFLTDGLPSVGEQDPERIAELVDRRRADTRVFAFGIGYDVNTYLLDRLSSAGRGATEYVEPDQDVEIALGGLMRRISHPVLADLEIGDGPVRLEEIYPGTLPDLFAGEDLVIFGRYRADSRDREGRLTLRGRRAGHDERFDVEAMFPRHENGNEFIPRLWAARKVGELSRLVRLNGASQELVDEIRSTALRYGILTEYTSYLVQEPGLMAERMNEPGGVIPMSAPAPTRATGRAAVVMAKDERSRRETVSQVALEEQEQKAANRLIGGVGEGFDDDAGNRDDGQASHRTVHGRIFQLSDGVWTDVSHRSANRVVEIEPFSVAYFELLDRMPELKQVLGEFESVLVAGGEASIRVVTGGEAELSERQLNRLVEDFRA